MSLSTIIDKLVKLDEIEALDKRIAQVSLELADVEITRKEQEKARHAEVEGLHRALNSVERQFELRQKQCRQAKDLSEYRRSCKQAYEKESATIPLYALARQAELCHRVHVMTAVDNQLVMTHQHTRELTKFLEGIVREQQEETASTQMHLLNDIMQLEAEIYELESKLQSLPIKIYNKPVDVSCCSGDEMEKKADNTDETEVTYSETESDESLLDSDDEIGSLEGHIPLIRELLY